ncbi:VanZ family protein [Nocardioides sp.]|uniref:VanZ family protein n=1 Tax=Nocardioides sp. TaxID=35761 RepID=UPI003518832E
MSDQLTNALLAMAGGTVGAILLFVPTAAYQYRLDGRLDPRDLLTLAAAPVYALALWTYTLLPFPDPDRLRCQDARLDPRESLELVSTHGRGLAGVLTDPAFLQLALNVALFVPLGWFLRVVLRRGLPTALGVGLAMSLLVELTQLSGAWGLYDCAFRTFDVDDLITNTAGAVAGSLVAFLALDRVDPTTPPLPAHVSLGRRLAGLASDLLLTLVLGGAVAAIVRGVLVRLDAPPSRGALLALALLVVLAAQAVSVLASTRTLGEHVVAVRPAPPVPAAGRLRLLLAGPGLLLGGLALGALSWQASLAALGLLGLAHGVALALTRDQEYRGLPGLLAGTGLVVAAEEHFAGATPGLGRAGGLRD